VAVQMKAQNARRDGLSAAARFSPANGHIKFECREARDAEAVIGQLFERRFDLKVSDPSAFDFSLDHFACGPGVSLSRMTFGSEVAVRIDRVESFMVQMPLAGHNDLVLDGTRPLSLSSRMFSVINPGRSVSQRRHEDCEMILVRFDEKPLTQCLTAHLGESDDLMAASGPIEFAAVMSTGRRGGSAWMRLMSFVLGELHKSDSVFLSPLAASQAGNLIMSTLLLNQPHNYSKLLQRPAQDMTPRFVRDARNWIDANAHRPITVDELARQINLSTRTVYSGFRKYLSQTPMDYLKEVRLCRVREELLAAQGRGSVTSIAMDWGFTHLGNFARDYRVKFGELPSQTLHGRVQR
jgi:AraC-like DNA-binding protein